MNAHTQKYDGSDWYQSCRLSFLQWYLQANVHLLLDEHARPLKVDDALSWFFPSDRPGVTVPINDFSFYGTCHALGLDACWVQDVLVSAIMDVSPCRTNSALEELANMIFRKSFHREARDNVSSLPRFILQRWDIDAEVLPC